MLSLLVGMPLGTALALARFPGRGLVVAWSTPAWACRRSSSGLFVSIMLWRSGPLGALGLLYTPTAIVVAQFVIAVPGRDRAHAGRGPADPRGSASRCWPSGPRGSSSWLLVREARLPLLAALMAGFGAVISEVGASLMVGGNIRGQTRVLTTATVLETGKGNFDVAIALSISCWRSRSA